MRELRLIVAPAAGTVVAPGNICYTGCGGKTENCFPACMWFSYAPLFCRRIAPARNALTEPARRGSDYTLLEDGTTETITGDSPLRTYMDINIKPIDPDPRVPDEPIDIYGMHPWHHPGRAPVWSPCGIGGGNPRGCFVPGTSTPQKCPEGASQNGPDARYFPFPDVKTTVCEHSIGCSRYRSTRSLTQPLQRREEGRRCRDRLECRGQPRRRILLPSLPAPDGPAAPGVSP